MFKKLSMLFMTFALPLSFAYAEESKIETNVKQNSPVQSENIEKKEDPKTVNMEHKTPKEKIDALVKDSNPFFKNAPLSENDQKIQEEAIKEIKKKYIDANNYNVEELNEYFGDAIVLGFNKLADMLLNDPKAQININRYNNNGFTPLMLSAMTEIEGGNVEYARKLINAGADPDQLSLKNQVPVISLATTTDKYKVVTLLIFAGANFLKVDDMDMAPIDYAFKYNAVRSANILKEAILLQTDQYVKKENKQ